MARPRKKLTEEQIIQVESLASIMSLECIADYFGIAKRIFYQSANNEVTEKLFCNR